MSSPRLVSVALSFFMELIYTNRKGISFTILYDECDHKLVSKHSWHVNGQGYVQSSIRCGDGKWRSFQMHRLILGITDPKIEVDHIRHNKLDNRRSELRACTRSENQQNKSAAGKSKYLGVGSQIFYNKNGGARGPYIRARIRVHKKLIQLGVFQTEEDAARAYDEAAKKYFGEFANLNFPEQ